MSNPAGSVFKWEQETIKIDTAKDFEFDAIVTKIQESSLKLPPPLADSEHILSHKEAARNETNASITHQCDITLRKLVGSMVKEESKKELGKQALKLYAEKCNVKREKF